MTGVAPDGSGELVVVDYKTGRHVLTVDDARTSLPLALYALAAERVMRAALPAGRAASSADRPGARLGAHAPSRWPGSCAGPRTSPRSAPQPTSGSGARRPGGGRQMTRPGLPDAQLDEVFPPRPGSWCGWCDYRAHCPEGSAASEPRQPWDGLGPGPTRLTRRGAGRPGSGRGAGRCRRGDARPDRRPPRVLRSASRRRALPRLHPERRQRAGRGLGGLHRRGVARARYADPLRAEPPGHRAPGRPGATRRRSPRRGPGPAARPGSRAQPCGPGRRADTCPWPRARWGCCPSSAGAGTSIMGSGTPVGPGLGAKVLAPRSGDVARSRCPAEADRRVPEASSGPGPPASPARHAPACRAACRRAGR